MSEDLIKRSDAIDAIECVTWYHQNRNKDMVSGANSDEHQAWYKSQDIYEALENIQSADRPQDWIPCSERLPEETGRYLCTVGAPYRNPREMYYAPQEWADKSDHATWRSIDGSYVFDWFVEAWQPLPEPWKGADDE